jgi:hypothetical protein
MIGLLFGWSCSSQHVDVLRQFMHLSNEASRLADSGKIAVK